MPSPRLMFTTGIALFSSIVAAPSFADTVTGKVVGPEGKPVAGATVIVSVFSATPSTKTETLTSDAEGAFSLDISSSSLVFDKTEKNPKVARVVVIAPGFGLAQTFLTRNPSEDNTIHLAKGVPLRGKVVDTEGKPLAGIAVQVQSLYLGGPRGNGSSYLWIEGGKAFSGLSAKTDSEGVWTFTNLPATAVHAGVAIADTKYVQTASEIPLSGAADKPIVARIAASLTGKVVGKDGKPRAGVPVFSRQENYGAGMANGVTAADGTYRLPGLPSGIVAVWVDQGSYLNAEKRSLPEEVAAPLRQIAVEEGKETAVPDIVLVPGGIVQGTVTDAVDGKPVPKVQVMVPDSIGVSSAITSGISEENGKFALRLPPGTYRLSIPWEPEGYLKTTETGEENIVEVKVTEGATVPISFRLARALTLSGVALDTSGKPVSGVAIAVMDQGIPAKATTDAEGKWTLKGVKPGKVRLIGANDYEVVSGNEIIISPKETPPSVTLTVKPFKPSPATGRVLSSGGQPIAGVMIQALTKMAMGGGSYWFDFQESRTDAQGRFTLPPIRPENSEVTLKFEKPGYKATAGGTVARQGDRFVITDAVLRVLDKGRTIKGRVVDIAGKPVASAVVAATNVENGSGEIRTDTLGRFTLNGVPEDSQLLAAQGILFGAAPVTRTTGTAPLVLRLAPLKKPGETAAEDQARARAMLWEMKKQYLAAKQQNRKTSDFIVRGIPYDIAPLDFPFAVTLAKPEGKNPIDDQIMAQMIREVAKNNPERINDWAIPALKDIGISAVRASAAYAVVQGMPEGPAKKAMAKQVYQEMQTMTLTGSEHWVVRRITQIAVLAVMLGLPEESNSWLDKAMTQSMEDKEKQYISVVADEAVWGGLPMIRRVLQKVEAKERAMLYRNMIPSLARQNARAAYKLLQEMGEDKTLPVESPENDIYHSNAPLEVIRALAPQDPNAALQIAERMDGSQYQPAALALTAQAVSDKQKAAGLFERAANLTYAVQSPEVVAKIAALAMKNDPALGKKLFARANQLLDTRNGNEDLYTSATRVQIIKEYPESSSGEGRLRLAVAGRQLLTPEAQKEDSSGSYRQILALAWLPFSVDQALAVSERIPEKQEQTDYEIRNRTLGKIAVWLLTEPAKRNKKLLSDYDQYGFESWYY